MWYRQVSWCPSVNLVVELMRMGEVVTPDAHDGAGLREPGCSGGGHETEATTRQWRLKIKQFT